MNLDQKERQIDIVSIREVGEYEGDSEILRDKVQNIVREVYSKRQ